MIRFAWCQPQGCNWTQNSLLEPSRYIVFDLEFRLKFFVLRFLYTLGLVVVMGTQLGSTHNCSGQIKYCHHHQYNHLLGLHEMDRKKLEHFQLQYTSKRFSILKLYCDKFSNDTGLYFIFDCFIIKSVTRATSRKRLTLLITARNCWLTVITMPGVSPN